MGMLQLGPLTIKYEWVIFFLAGVITYFVLNKIIRNKTFKSEFIDILFNILFIWIVAFKLSIILFRPNLLFENPLGILYFNGGSKGMFVASILSIIYFIWKYKKLNWTKDDTIQAIIYTTFTFLISFWLIRTISLLFITSL